MSLHIFTDRSSLCEKSALKLPGTVVTSRGLALDRTEEERLQFLPACIDQELSV